MSWKFKNLSSTINIFYSYNFLIKKSPRPPISDGYGDVLVRILVKTTIVMEYIATIIIVQKNLT